VTARVASGPAWLNPAGGLRYHLRGFRHSKKLWWPFRFHLADWLYAWQPPERTLVVVGPSGGYCIEPLTLERFERLVCLEPDPVARFLFQRRLARAPLEKRPRIDFVSDDLILEDPTRFERFLEKEGRAAVLFSNFLGQLRVLLGSAGPDPRLSETKRTIVRALAGRSWASFHDRVSGALAPSSPDPFLAERRLSDEELIETFYAHHRIDSPEAPLIGVDGSLPLLDHLTADLFPSEREHRYFVWELMPGQYHLIEAVSEAGSPGEAE
jgi:hypothetical protein